MCRRIATARHIDRFERSSILAKLKTFTSLIAFASLFFCLASHAIEREKPESQSLQQHSVAGDSHGTYEALSSMKDTIQANAQLSARETNKLEIYIKLQEEKIKHLEKDILDLKKPANTDPVALVLASVSVIITVLGVLIAILSILGYSNIKKEAIKDARTIAKESVELIAKVEIPKATEANLIKLIEENRFDELIQSAVENIAYRGISIPDSTSIEERAS